MNTASAPITGSTVVEAETNHAREPAARSYAASCSPSSAKTANASRKAGGAVSALLSGSVQILATGNSASGVLSAAERVCLTARVLGAGICARADAVSNKVRATALQHIVVRRIATPL